MKISACLFEHQSKLCRHIPLCTQLFPLPFCLLLVFHPPYLLPCYGPPIPLQRLDVHFTPLRYRYRTVDQPERKSEGLRHDRPLGNRCKHDSQRSTGSTGTSIHVFSGFSHNITKIECRWRSPRGHQICE